MSPFETAQLEILNQIRDALLILCWAQGVEEVTGPTSIALRFETIETLLKRKYTQTRQVDE